MKTSPPAVTIEPPRLIEPRFRNSLRFQIVNNSQRNLPDDFSGIEIDCINVPHGGCWQG